MAQRILSYLYTAMLAVIFAFAFVLVCTSCSQQAPKSKPASLGKGRIYMSQEDYDPYVPPHKVDRSVTFVPQETPTVRLIAQRGPSLAMIDRYREQLSELLVAIGTVESMNKDDAVGDNGKAIGRFQIWEVYHRDAVEYAPAIDGQYYDVTERVYAERVVVAYMMRYAEDSITAGRWDVLARIHNGGPKGARKSATLKYWRKVEKELAN